MPTCNQRSNAALACLIGDDEALRATKARAALVSPTMTPVLIVGESGTGKELLARAIHEMGPAPDGPFVTVNCGALPRELAESELFGHERGSFTGACGRREGWFEEASGGTLVLDEIGELPVDLQPKLLRALECGRIRRVGGTGETTVRVRIVAMTLRDLKTEVRRGAFRLDLYHRLAGFELPLSPLRQRTGDLEALARHFLREAEPELGPRDLDPQALRLLASYTWPGNVRELRNVIRRAALLTGACIDPSSLELTPPCEARLVSRAAESAEPEPAAAPQTADPANPTDTLNLVGRTFEDIEREIFRWALRRNGGSRRQAARALSVSRSTFCDRVKRYGIA